MGQIGFGVVLFTRQSGSRGMQVAKFLRDHPQRGSEGAVRYLVLLRPSAPVLEKLSALSVPVVELVDGEIGSGHWKPHPATDSRLKAHSSAATWVVEIGAKAVSTEGCVRRCAEQIRNIFGRSTSSYPFGMPTQRRASTRHLRVGRSTHSDVGRYK